MRRREDAPRNDAFTKMEDGCDSQDETGERPRRQAGAVRASHPLHSSACANTPCHNNVHMRPLGVQLFIGQYTQRLNKIHQVSNGPGHKRSNYCKQVWG